MTSAKERLLALPMNFPRNERQWADHMRKLRECLISAFSDIEGKIASTQAPKIITGNRGSAQDTSPLTATDAGASATINVAEHTVRHGSGSYTFGAGTITGLSYATRYFVYADAPDYQDYPAPTYLAVTAQQTVTADDGRYYVGDVTTPAMGAGDTTGGGGAGGGGSGVPWP